MLYVPQSCAIRDTTEIIKSHYISSLCYHFCISHFWYSFEVINKNCCISLSMMTYVILNYVTHFNLDRSRSHVHNGISIAFWYKYGLCHNGNAVMMYKYVFKGVLANSAIKNCKGYQGCLFTYA